MIQNERVLAVITARGGSKGIPRKNIRDFGGKPLIAWSIEAAKASACVDRVVVSSEDAEILSVARGYGEDVPLERPAELAQDQTPGVDPVIHALQFCPGYDRVILLQPTSPLRIAQDIDAAVRLCLSKQASTCVSVSEAPKSPYLFYQVSSESLLQPLMDSELRSARRQDVPCWYVLNGAVYVAKADYLLRHRTFLEAGTVGYVMPVERSADIDTESDWIYAESLLAIRK